MTNKEIEIEFDFFKSKSIKKNIKKDPLIEGLLLYLIFFVFFLVLSLIMRPEYYSQLHLPSKNQPKIQQITPKIQNSQNQTTQLVIQENMSKKQNISYISTK